MLTLLSDDVIARRDQEDVLLGLHLETGTYLLLLEALQTFGKVRKHIEEDLTRLRSYTWAVFKKSSKKSLFEKNLRFAMEDTLGEDILLSLLSDTSQVNRLNSFLLACFSLSESHFKEIESHGLIAGFHRLLEKQPCHFSEPLKQGLIRWVLEICHANKNGNVITEYFHSTTIITSPEANTERRKRKRQESNMMESHFQSSSIDPRPNDATNLEPWQTTFLLGPCTINRTGNKTANMPDISSGSEHMSNRLSTSLPDSVPNTPSLAGDVYELNTNDVVMAALSGMVEGNIRLTDPYYASLSPFINMPIADSLKNQFIKYRHRIL
ncbi:hypothetical protein EYB25_003227 [Talaromyces marneffei]|nr:hypothetical protein EYB25_003227 [Talaromyces marneffei]